METGLTGFDEVDIAGGATAGGVRVALARPTPDRLLTIAQALRLGLTVEEIHAACRYDPWFLREIAEDRRRRGGGEGQGPARQRAMLSCA